MSEHHDTWRHRDPFKDREAIPYRYVRGPLDGETGLYYDKELRPEVRTSLYCEDKGGGHIWWPNTNDYAVYRLHQVDDDEWVYLFYGVEHMEIDITRGADYIISRHWVSIDRVGMVEK